MPLGGMPRNAQQLPQVRLTRNSAPTQDRRSQVAALRASGYRIALDDFDSRPRSLAVLNRPQPDIIKLDRTITQGALLEAEKVIQTVREDAGNSLSSSRKESKP